MANSQDKGWVSLHRELKDKGYYKKSAYVHLWVHLLLSANHESAEFLWNGQIIKLQPGQFITGRKKLAEETGLKETTVERVLECFESGQQIGQQKTTKYRLITIVNWEKWQKSDNKIDSKRTTNGQQTDTNNNNNNNNKEKREAIASPPTPKDRTKSFFKGITDLMLKEKTPEAEAMAELLRKVSSEQGIESWIKKKAFWDEIVKFGDYWQEKDQLGKKEKWQMQKTFEVDKRLQTWLRRAGQWSKPTSQNNKNKPNYVL
jgi:hypothetical protein